jgi:hypothetical protein
VTDNTVYCLVTDNAVYNLQDKKQKAPDQATGETFAALGVEGPFTSTDRVMPGYLDQTKLEKGERVHRKLRGHTIRSNKKLI